MAVDEHSRPDPEALLAHVQAEEAKKKRGRLKIFLGYAAGVGKTFAMLEAAGQRKAEGVDVVVAYIDTHGRAETEEKLAGLEILPRKPVEYRNVALTDLDLDAVLARRPKLVLVDELAHTNAPGLRHAKRFMDVEEILAHGIDVYTTLNIQHLESLNDVIEQITEIKVRETIPDRVLDEAAEIELIDLPPDELLQRLKEGKVYIPEQAARAIEKFFRTGNLTALREIAMRRAAERVDEQMRDYMTSRAIPGPWPAAERVLVCVSAAAFSERLVREGRRLADQLNAEWFILYVETSQHFQLSEAERDILARTLRLGEELGAQTIRLPGHSIGETVSQYVRTHNITKIIVGRPLRPRWLELLRGPVIDQVIRKSGNVDVLVVSSTEHSPALPQGPGMQRRTPWQRYIPGLVVVALMTVFGEIIDQYLHPTNLVMLYLLAVVLVAVSWGRGPATLVSFLSVVAFDFFFVPPRYTLTVDDLQYLLTFSGLLVVGLVISALASQARDQAEAAQRRQIQTAALYDLSRDLAGSALPESIFDVVTKYISRTFDSEVVILLPDAQHLAMAAATANDAFDADEMAVAEWCFRQGQSAGRGTGTLPAAGGRYIPLKTVRGTIGVLGVLFRSENELLPEQWRLLEAAASLSALVIERGELAEQARRMLILQETEKLQAALLNSISHDLRTPLASITGSLSSLRQNYSLKKSERDDLVETALGEAERLNRLVGNLLDMSRLEAGIVRVNKEPDDVQDLIGVALQEIEARAGDREIVVDIPSDLPLVPMDLVLISRVLVNVLDNAIKYSNADTPIEISARRQDETVEIEVADRGVGIPQEDIDHVFDKFYRVRRADSVGGTGLGLSISKGLAEAHGGHIRARTREGGGTVVTLMLPLNNLE